MIVARKAHGGADGEQQAKIVEDRAAGCGQKSKVQERKDRLNRARYVLLAQAQKNARDRQNRDGQHQGAAEALEGVDDLHAKLS